MVSVLSPSIEAIGDTLNNAALATPGVAVFCSGSEWQWCAHQSLCEPRQVLVAEHDRHWVWLARSRHGALGNILQPLENLWAFGCPLLGPSPEHAVDLLVKLLKQTAWNALFLSGIPVGSTFEQLLPEKLQRLGQLRTSPGSDCLVAHIGNGLAEYLARRDNSFRTNLRRCERLAAKEAIEAQWLEHPQDVASGLKRLLAIEMLSWKGQQNNSIFRNGDFELFYGQLMRQLADSSRLRLLFARQGECDVAYILGGVLGNTYRGFQLAYDERFARLGLGNLLQCWMIQRLANEGITTYDLGMVMDYKMRWADDTLRLNNYALFSFYRV